MVKFRMPSIVERKCMDFTYWSVEDADGKPIFQGRDKAKCDRKLSEILEALKGTHNGNTGHE
jgi:hypothetical protein